MALMALQPPENSLNFTGKNRLIIESVWNGNPMNIHLSRNGQQFGPYPLESLAGMIRAGNVDPTDLLLVDGQTEWVPVSTFLKYSGMSPVEPAVEPPLPPSTATSQAAGAAPPVILGNAEGFSDLERQVLEGGRFVIYQYCISILVMTFKRPSIITFLRNNEDGGMHAFGYSLISLVAGWWGFPWGPIWTIATLINNLRGGTDVTEAVLAQKIGPARAAWIMAQRKPPQPRVCGMKIFRWGLAGAGALLLLMLGLVAFGIFSAGEAESRRPKVAGEAGFKAANNLISIHRGTVASGNSPQAVAVAARFSQTMKGLRDGLFEGGKKDGFSVSRHEFLTHCEMHDGTCAIIVHVPELRRFSNEAKDSLAEIAWITAQTVVREQAAGQPGMKLAVGLRGVLSYDRVLMGKLVSGVTNTDTGVFETIKEYNSEQRLFPFFRPPSGIREQPATQAVGG